MSRISLTGRKPRVPKPDIFDIQKEGRPESAGSNRHEVRGEASGLIRGTSDKSDVVEGPRSKSGIFDKSAVDCCSYLNYYLSNIRAESHGQEDLEVA